MGKTEEWHSGGALRSDLFVRLLFVLGGSFTGVHCVIKWVTKNVKKSKSNKNLILGPMMIVVLYQKSIYKMKGNLDKWTCDSS